MNQGLKRNISLDYIFTFLQNFNLTHALWMIWLSMKGFTLLQLGIIEGVFHVTSFLMEVPTGAVADIWGRKLSRLAGRIAFLISIFILWFGENIGIQMVGFILTAIGYNLESGAGEALVYDSLLKIKEEGKFKAVRGRTELILQSSMILAYLSGGYFATKDYGIVFTITIIFAAFSIINVLFMTEPIIIEKKAPVDKNIGKMIISSLLSQTKESLIVIKNQPRIAYLIIYSESIFVFVTTQYFYLQTWWKFNGYSEFYMGITFGIQAILAGLSGLIAPKIEKYISDKLLFKIIPILLLISLWGVSIFEFKALFFIFSGIFEGILVVTISDYINKMIPSEYRATILSYQSMVFSLLMVLLFPIIGLIGDKYNLELGFTITSVIGTILFLLYLFIFRDKSSKNR